LRMNQLFIEDVLSDKCLMAVCPMVRCDGELEYQHPVDCCGTCVPNEDVEFDDDEFPTTDSSGLSEKCFTTMCPMVMCEGELVYRNEDDCCGSCERSEPVPMVFRL